MPPKLAADLTEAEWLLIQRSLDWTDEGFKRTSASPAALDIRRRRGPNKQPAALPAWPLGACTYFIGAKAGPVKIGYSTNVAQRLETIQISSPVRLEILAAEAGPRIIESGYHALFANDRIHGEWFARTDRLMALIARIRAEAVQTVQGNAGIARRFRKINPTISEG